MKYLDIKEFREKGYLQEVNRRFFHPLGLALEVKIDNKTNEESIEGIWDFRKNKESIYYDIKNRDKLLIEKMKKKKEFIDAEFDKYKEKRKQLIGSKIEKIK